MMQLVGLLILSACPMAAGFLLSQAEVKKPREIEGFVLLVSHIRYEIGSFLTKQQDLFYRFENEALMECGFLPSLKARRLSDEHSVLYEALLSHKEKLHVGEEAFRVLLDYAQDLGKRDAGEEVRRAQKAQDLLEVCLQKIKEESRKKVRLYRAFGVVMGLFFFLLAL